MARERADFLKFGNESLIKELLPVLDNLELSLEHARNATNANAITEGIELVKKEFLRKLEKFGLSAISARGEKFDPNRHEAAVQIETAEHPEDTVIDEFQKGYFIHDRLLRPARVSVAKAPHPQKTNTKSPSFAYLCCLLVILLDVDSSSPPRSAFECNLV